MIRRRPRLRRSTWALIGVLAAQVASCGWSPWLACRPAANVAGACATIATPPPAADTLWCQHDGPAGVGPSWWLILLALVVLALALAIWLAPFLILARRAHDARMASAVSPPPL